MIILPTMRASLSAWSPLSYAPALWLSDTGGGAGTWPDLSGNGRNATGATPPSIVTGALNGRQVRRFNGTNQFLTIDGSASSLKFLHSAQSSVFIVFKNSNTSGDGMLLATNDGTTLKTGYFAYLPNNSSSSILITKSSLGSYVVSATYTSYSSSSFSIWSAITDVTLTAALRLLSYRNSAPLGETNSASNSAVSTDSSVNMLIGKYGSSSGFLNGDIAEILVFPRALTTSERQRVERYLNSKYAIY